MQNVSAVLALLCCAAIPAAADVYKWIDREGRVQYSDTPPANAPSWPVDLPNIGTEVRLEVSQVVEQKPLPEPSRQAAAAPQAPAAAPVPVNRGMAFEVYIMLRNGMTEGELLQRAGSPDYESADGKVGSAVITGRRGVRVQSFNNLELRKHYYFPTLSDPFTTVVTLTGGLISDLQRTRKF